MGMEALPVVDHLTLLVKIIAAPELMVNSPQQ